MATVNVNRGVTDPFYRYKMPRLIAKVEGKGNGIKTVIVNMSEIAKALDRPPTYPTKYFGCELGAQTQFDLKNERFIVNGAHEAAKLQDLLDGFIQKYVLCNECENPETTLVVSQKGNGRILQHCIACGHNGTISSISKLATFILRNPPDKGKGKDKRNKKNKGKEDEVDCVDMMIDNANGKTIDEEIEDEIDWPNAEDFSDAAVKQRQENISAAIKVLAVNSDLEKTTQERMDMFYELVKKHKDENTILGAVRDLCSEAERLDIKEKAPLVLVELLLDESIMNQVVKLKKVFLRFTNDNPKAQRNLLGGLELLIGTRYQESLMAKVAHILKIFYDNDILDEEVLLDWDKRASKKFVSKEISQEVHVKAAPFMTWLREAEEDSSDDSDEVEVDFDNTSRNIGKVISASSDGKNGVSRVEIDPDLEHMIDDI